MRTRDRIAAWAVLVTLAFGVFAIGSSTRWTSLITALLGVGCAAVYIRSRRQFDRVPPFLELIALAAMATIVQILPLPSKLVGVLSPAKLEIAAANAAALGEAAPGWLALSVDPPAGLVALATLVGYIGVAIAAVRVAGHRTGRLFLARALVGVATAVALAALFHGVAGLERVFGIYQPQAVRDPVLLAPLLNPNHLAGFLAVAAPVGVGLAVSAKGTARLLWVLATSVCVIVALLAESRTGVVSLAVGLFVVAAFLLPKFLSERRGHRRDRTRTVAIGCIVITLIASGLYYYGGGAIDELADTELDELTGKKSKAALWSKAAPLVWEYPLAGVGRGAFEPAFNGATESRFTFSHVENELLQTVIDWGVPVAIGMLILLVIAARTAARRSTRSSLEAGLFAGLVAAAIHHLADFAIELPGVALLVLVAFASLSRVELRVAESRPLPAPIARAVGVALGVVVIALAAIFGATAREEVDDLAADGDRVPTARLEARALRSWRRHPRDYRAAGQVAVVLARSRDARAFAVMNRALAMRPNDASLQHAAARMLLQSQRPEQAIGHFRLAIRHSPQPAPLIEELARRWPDADVAVTGLPTDQARLRLYFNTLRTLAPELRFQYAERLAAQYPSNGYVHLELAGVALALEKFEIADVAGQRAWDKLGNRGGALLSARARLALELPERAADAIEAARDRGSPAATSIESIAELRVLATARQRLENHRGAVLALEEALQIAGQKGASAATIMRQLSGVHKEMGNHSQAARYRDLADSLSGGRR